MQVGLAQCVNKGMQRDYSMDKASQEFAYENHNIRITTTGNESFLSVTNERSTIEFHSSNIICVITNKYSGGEYNELQITHNIPDNKEVILKITTENPDEGKEQIEYFTINNKNRAVNTYYTYNTILKVESKDEDYNVIIERINDTKNDYSFSTHIQGIVLGSALIGDVLIIFTKNYIADYIYKCIINNNSNTYSLQILYEGDLKFNINNPIECLTSYENDDVQKVYWVDGLNPCRVINICNTYNSNHSFDFKPKVNVPINVNISKLYNGAGNFKSGIVQYAITVYNKFEAESNIVYISPLHYISPQDRGGKVDELITCSFKIDITVPKGFKYQNARVYAIYRNSLNGEVQASIVEDIELKEGVCFTIDNNTSNIPVASTDVLFLNNSAIIANTITQQNNTLFLGNIKEEASSFDLNAIKEVIESKKTNTDRNFTSKEDEKHLPEEVLKFKWKVVGFESSKIGTQYEYYNQLTQDSSKIKTFKHREVYRFGIQFQDESLAWTQTLWLDDLVCDKYPRQEDDFEIKENSPINKDDYFIFDSEEIETSEDIQGGIKLNKKYNKCLLLPFIWFNPIELFGAYEFPANTKYRLVMAEATMSDRSIICQGYVNPTLYNNRIGSVNSWNIKPVNDYNKDSRNVLHVEQRNIEAWTEDLKDFYPEEQQKWWLPTPRTEIDLSAYNYNADEIGQNGNDNILREQSFISNSRTAAEGAWQLSDIKIIYRCMYLQGNLAEGHVMLDFRFYNGSVYKTIETTVLRQSIALNNKTILANTPYRYKTYQRTKEVIQDITYNTEDSCLPGHVWDSNDKDGYSTTKFTTFDAYFKEQLGINSTSDIINYNKEDYIINASEFPYVTKKEAKEETTFQTSKVITKAINLDYLKNQIQRLDNHYFINANRCSFHTPDIENIDEILNESDVKFRIVGRVPLTKNISDYVISAEDTVYGNLEDVALKFKFSGNYNEDLKTYGLQSYPLWYSYARTVGDKQYEALYNWVYLWNSQGLSHVDVSTEGAKSKVKNKVFANIFYGDNTIYRLEDTTDVNNNEKLDSLLWKPIKGVKNIRSANNPITYIEGGLYKKDIHDVMLPLSDYVYGMSQVYKSDFQPYDYNYTKVVNWGDATKSDDSHFEPINIKYDSTNHIVFEFENTDIKRVVLPNYNESRLILDDSVYNILDSQTYPKYTSEKDNRVYQTQYASEPMYFDTYFSVSEEASNIYNYTGEIQYKDGDTLYVITNDYMWGDIVGLMKIRVINDNIQGILYYKPTLNDLKNNFSDVLEFRQNNEISFKTSLLLKLHNKYGYYEVVPTILNRIIIFEPKFYDLYSNNSKIELKDNNTNYLWVGEFYKEFDDYLPYGGTSENALETNVFIPISDVTSISEQGYGFEGDTYFQRWDSLRTYPKDEEEKNGIVDVVSLMLETHTNLDGRSDVTRGRSDVVNIRPNNIIDTINTVYSQPNNYITSSVLDEKYSKREYPSLVAWSLSKQALSDIDTWTNINLSSSIQLDSSKGFVNKLITHNNSLLAFQDNALGLINYNLQTTISSAEGVPVEIANSGKVTGYHYISTTQGCKNKWSIIDSPYGIYFIDSNNKSINVFNSEGIKSLSSINLMQDWILENEKGVIWNPNNNGGFKSFYDSIHNEVYFINDKTALCYNELLTQFTSFYDYDKLNTMIRINGSIYGIKDNKLHRMFEGDAYCNLFGEQKDYSITYKINKDPFIDKTWTNIEYRADIFNTKDIQDIPSLSNNTQSNNTQIVSNTTFDKLEVWNEYQYGSSNMSKAKPKFRIWRADIPRDTKEGRGLNRIRNPWIMIKLSKENNTDKPINTDKRMEFHDLLIKYLQ